MADEEGSQFKCYHWLFGHVGVRGVAEPELAHPAWNSYKRALRHAGLEMDAMKLTLISNYGHGSFKSGDRMYTRQQYVKAWLDKKQVDYFESVAEEIALDRGHHHVDAADARVSMSDFLESPLISRRGGYAPWH